MTLIFLAGGDMIKDVMYATTKVVIFICVTTIAVVISLFSGVCQMVLDSIETILFKLKGDS